MDSSPARIVSTASANVTATKQGIGFRHVTAADVTATGKGIDTPGRKRPTTAGLTHIMILVFDSSNIHVCRIPECHDCEAAVRDEPKRLQPRDTQLQPRDFLTGHKNLPEVNSS